MPINTLIIIPICNTIVKHINKNITKRVWNKFEHQKTRAGALRSKEVQVHDSYLERSVATRVVNAGTQWHAVARSGAQGAIQHVVALDGAAKAH